jgi:hypothetical protein
MEYNKKKLNYNADFVGIAGNK